MKDRSPDISPSARTVSLFGMKTLIAVLALSFAVSLSAQVMDAQSQQGYQTADDALYAALLTVGSYPISAVLPTQTVNSGTPQVTWSVVRQADASECHESSQDQTWPSGWSGTDSCGSGLGAPLTHTEATLGDLRTWILANLDSGQRASMVVIHPVGHQRAALSWWVIYQTHQAFCF